MEEIEKHDMTFGIGPGGTGKTYIAVAMAVSALLTKQRESNYFGAAGGRSWGAAGVFARDAAAEDRSIHAAAV